MLNDKSGTSIPTYSDCAPVTMLPELLYIIFEYLHNALDPADPTFHQQLLPFGSVCKTWRAIYLPFQYRFVHIGSGRQCAHLYDLLQIMPVRASLIRYLFIPCYHWLSWNLEAIMEANEIRLGLDPKSSWDGHSVETLANHDLMSFLELSMLCPNLLGIGVDDCEFPNKVSALKRQAKTFILSVVSDHESNGSAATLFDYFTVPYPFLSRLCQAYMSRTTHFHLSQRYLTELPNTHSNVPNDFWIPFEFTKLEELHIVGSFLPPSLEHLTNAFKPIKVGVSIYTEHHLEFISRVPLSVQTLEIHISDAQSVRHLLCSHIKRPIPLHWGNSKSSSRTLVYIFDQSTYFDFHLGVKILLGALRDYRGKGKLCISRRGVARIQEGEQGMDLEREIFALGEGLVQDGVFEEVCWDWN